MFFTGDRVIVNKEIFSIYHIDKWPGSETHPADIKGTIIETTPINEEQLLDIVWDVPTSWPNKVMSYNLGKI